MDVVDSLTRSRMMSGIKECNTKPEMLIVGALSSRGFQLKLNNMLLPGKPDIVLRKYRAVIMINGCFWHAHQCELFKWPKTREEFWRKNISANSERDKRDVEDLLSMNWRVLTIWECVLRNKQEQNLSKIMTEIVEWILGNKNQLIIPDEDEKFYEE